MTSRRNLLAAATAVVGASTIAAPHVARAQPTFRWRMPTSFPKSLDALHGNAEYIARRVAEATDNNFQIRVFPSGELIPPLQVLDSVQNGTVECGVSASYYYIGKDPTFAFDTTLPFGFDTRQQDAWMRLGGGLELMRELFASYNIYNIPCGNTGAQMGGWFRKELKSLDDLKGLKFRIGGLAGQVLTQLGIVPTQIAAADVYPALERGTIDAAEFTAPHDDEKLGFYQIAKYYYYPGWWEGTAQLSLYVGKPQWEALPKTYQSILEQACADAMGNMLAQSDTLNGPALKRLVANGVQLRPFPRDILDASWQACNALYDKIAGENPRFAKVLESWRRFREDSQLWYRIGELSYENALYTQLSRR